MSLNTKRMAEILSCHPLFEGVSQGDVGFLLDRSKTVEHRKGDLLNEGAPALVFLLSGTAKVEGADGRSAATRNLLGKGDIFGAAQMFCSGERMSSVVAAGLCRCLVIPKEAVEDLLRRNPGFVDAYLAFLSDRIRFLNRRISSFTAGRGEHVLAAYLMSCPGVQDGAVLRLCALSTVASVLNVTRPTLYHAFTVLEEAGAIRRDRQNVEILSVHKLSEFQ